MGTGEDDSGDEGGCEGTGEEDSGDERGSQGNKTFTCSPFPVVVCGQKQHKLKHEVDDTTVHWVRNTQI